MLPACHGQFDRAASILAQLTYRAARLWRSTHGRRRSIVHLAAEKRLSASASSCESVCLQPVRSILRNRRIYRYVGHDHVLVIGYCFTNGGHGLRTDIFTRKNRRFSDSFNNSAPRL